MFYKIRQQSFVGKTMLLVYVTALIGLRVSADLVPYCPSSCTCYKGPYSDFLATSMAEVMQEAHFEGKWNSSESYVERKLRLLAKPYVDATEEQINRWNNLLVNMTGNVTHMDCTITKQFDLGVTKRLLALISRQHVSMILRCTTPSRGPVRWVPESFVYFSILASLRFENCDITPIGSYRMIPASPNLLGLELVNVNSDFLDNLQFSNNSNLVSLQISYNKLITIPDGLRNRAYPNLLWLALNNNMLQSFDCSFIGGTPLLMELYIQNNQITYIPECLCKFKNLWKIPAYGNLITSFDVFRCFEDLIAIDARHNSITALNGGQFNKLTLLQEVNLGNNNIAYIEKGTFSDLQYLRKILLPNNQIGVFDTSMIATSFLPKVTIDLRNNNLSFLPFYDIDAPELGPNFEREVTIYLEGNTFYCGCGLKILQHFIRNPTISSDIKNVTCFEPAEFQSLRLVDVNISVTCRENQWCPRPCKCYRNIKTNEISVQCAGQGIQTVPRMIPKGNVSKLDLHNNVLTEFQNKTFLSRVRSLDVSHNKLNSISIEVFKYSSLVNLSYNHLISLPVSLQNIPLAEGMRVDLRNNPLSCSGETRWIRKWIAENMEHIVDPASLQLACPVHKTTTPVTPSVYKTTTIATPSNTSSNIALEISLVILLGLVFIILTLLVCFRLKLKSVCGYYFLRKKTRYSFRAGFPPLKVLIICCDKDSEWVFEHLILPLEGHHPPFATFLKSRDKQPGTPVKTAYETWLEDCDAVLIVISPDVFREDIDILQHIYQCSFDKPAKPIIGYQLNKTRADGIDFELLDFMHRIPRVYHSEPCSIKSLIYYINQAEAYSSQNTPTKGKCHTCMRTVNSVWFNFTIWCKSLPVCGLCDCRRQSYQDTTELTPQGGNAEIGEIDTDA